MNWDTTVIAGGIPLGALVSIMLSFLKSKFQIKGEQARNIVAICGLGYAILIGIMRGLEQATPSLEAYWGVFINAVLSGISLIFGSEGFYQWVGKLEVEAHEK
jgi:ABC-type Mn2+/Zn2+ transport system permease subunit